MKKGKLSRDVIRAKDRDKKQDTAFRIRLGKDDAGMQILEIRSGERTAIIAATDLLPPLKQVSEKLLAQGMPVLQRQRLEALQSAAQRALERQKPAFTLVSRPGWVEGKAFVHGQRLVGSLPKNRVFRPPGIDLGDRPAKFSARGSLEEWQELVRRVARDEPLVTFLLCVAFASMILHLLKVQPFAILLHAKSSVGKVLSRQVRRLGGRGRSLQSRNWVCRIIQGDGRRAGEAVLGAQQFGVGPQRAQPRSSREKAECSRGDGQRPLRGNSEDARHR